MKKDIVADGKIIEILRQTRHDWLNHIQIIKGNLELGNPDRAMEIIKEIIIDCENESKLSSLQLPTFAEYLLTYSWSNPVLQVKYRVKNNKGKANIEDVYIYNATKQVIELIAAALDEREENVLIITMDLQENERFYYDFQGKLANIDTIQSYFDSDTSKRYFQNVYFDEEELSIELHYNEK